MNRLTIITMAALCLTVGMSCPGLTPEQTGDVIGQEARDAAPGIGDAIRTIGQAQLDVTRSYADTGIQYYNANLNPAPQAGANRTMVYEGELVILRVWFNDELRSPDMESTGPAIKWQQLFGEPTVTLDSDNTAAVSFIAPDVDTDVELTFRVTVTLPSSGNTESSEIKVVILNRNPAANNPPIADAGEGRVARSGSQVTLSGEKSRDPDGDALSYRWERIEGPEVSMLYAKEASMTFTAPAVRSLTRMTFQLTVTDSAGSSHSDTVFVMVEP